MSRNTPSSNTLQTYIDDTLSGDMVSYASIFKKYISIRLQLILCDLQTSKSKFLPQWHRYYKLSNKILLEKPHSLIPHRPKRLYWNNNKTWVSQKWNKSTKIMWTPPCTMHLVHEFVPVFVATSFIIHYLINHDE